MFEDSFSESAIYPLRAFLSVGVLVLISIIAATI